MPATSPDVSDGDFRATKLESWVWFLSAAVILLLGAGLQVEESGRVSLKWFQVVLPETCTMKSRLGLECPGCGLTRSYIHILHGNLAAAWSTNWVSFLFFLFTCAQLPLSWMHAWLRADTKSKSVVYRRVIWANERAVFVLLAVLLLRWLIRLSA